MTRRARVRRATEIAGDRGLIVRTGLAAPTVRVRLPDVANRVRMPADRVPRDVMASDRRVVMLRALMAVAVLVRKDAMPRVRVAPAPKDHRETAIAPKTPKSRKTNSRAKALDGR